MPLSLAATRNVLRRFRRNRRGAAAVEFALVAPLFFALLFAIIEVALVFFASQVLETVTQDSARTDHDRSGAGRRNTPRQQFKDDLVCAKVTVLFDCENGIYVDVQSYPAFTTVTITDPIDAGNFVEPNNYTPAAPATSSWCGCSINGRSSSPSLATTSPICRQQAVVDGDRRVPERALL